MFEELEQIYDNIKNQFNIYEIGRQISEFVINKFDAEGCEIKLLEENNVFSRIHFALKNENGILHDQDEIDRLFGVKRTPVDNSLIGHCVKTDEKYCWIGKDESFTEWVHKQKEVPVHIISALKYLENMPNKTINNFIVLPIILPNDRRMSETYSARVVFHIFNLCNGILDESSIKNCVQKIEKIFNYISVIIFNAIFYNRARDEININRTIEMISRTSGNIDDVLEKTAMVFAQKLSAPLSTIWFPDPDLGMLVLHSFHIKPGESNVPINEERLKEVIETKAPKVLKAENCLIGQLLYDKNLPWVKERNLNDLASKKYKWDAIKSELETDQFVALPIRDKDSLLAIIVLHPTLIERDFEKIPLSFFRSYTNQISITLKYFNVKTFSDKARQLSEKLTPLVKKREEIFYNELVYKIMEVIDAEACSIFEAKGGDSTEKGIYLKATTDKREIIKKKIGTKIYDIDSRSITGNVTITGKPIIVYEVDRVHEFIPEIESISREFMEKTVSPLHYSYIAIPIPGGKQNFDDKNASALILRCINKKAKRGLTGFFNVEDRDLLNYVGVVLEYFKKVLGVLYERNALIDLIIHEIENPIVSIRGKIDAINEERQQDSHFDRIYLKTKLKDIEEMASLLKGWASNMGLLNQLLQDKPVSPAREWISLWSEIIKHVIYWMAPIFNEKGISPQKIIQVIMPQDKSEGKSEGGPKFNKFMKVFADKDHLRQVFYNLLSNAIKYKVKDKPLKINIDLLEGEEFVIVKMEDWGVGISPVQKEEIFKMGFRGTYAEKSNIKGKGFGLWLCKKLLTLNGLDIRVGQCKNPTIFEVVIPIKHWKD